MARKDYIATSLYIPVKLKRFLDGPVKEETKMKLSPYGELAIEEKLKRDGQWEAYQKFEDV